MSEKMKRVLVDFTVRLPVEFGEQYATKDHIEFCYNEGTWCASNLVDMIKAAFQPSAEDAADGDEVGCFCEHVTARVVEGSLEGDSDKLHALQNQRHDGSDGGEQHD